MKVQFVSKVAALIASVLVLAVTGCGNSTPPRITPPGIAEDAAQKAMQLYDTNKDGSLDYTELQKAPGLLAGVAQIKHITTMGNPKADQEIRPAKINAADIDARIQAWKDSKLARVTTNCTITRKGKPLVGATVTFVPESFLGSDLKPATGVTNAIGVAVVSLEGGPAQGVAPGYYRVQITKSGDNIPAKYNTETTFGQEVAGDTESAYGTQFDLNY
jgi:hypothetical protein